MVGEGGQGWRRPRRGWGGGVCPGGRVDDYDDHDDDEEEDDDDDDTVDDDHTDQDPILDGCVLTINLSR